MTAGLPLTNGFQKFIYNARASALGGAVTKPYYQELGEHAAVSTKAGAGGHAKASNERFTLSGGDIAYGKVWSQLDAYEDNGLYRTIVVSTIEHLSVNHGWLTADQIVTRLESVYDPRDYPGRLTPRILPAGSALVNLRIHGKAVNPQLPRAFTLSPEEKAKFFAGECDGDPSCTPEQVMPPLYFPDFGTVYLAEWTWVNPKDQKEQHLSMLRLALGSDFGAAGQGPSVTSDGVGWPS